MSGNFRDQAQTRNSRPGCNKTAMRRGPETKGSHSEVVNLVDCDISSTSEEKGRSGEGAMDIAHVTNQTVQQITKQSKIERRKSRSESLVNSIHWIGQVPFLRSIPDTAGLMLVAQSSDIAIGNHSPNDHVE